jgi:tetratricopeptide (TPR) repeat protein
MHKALNRNMHERSGKNYPKVSKNKLDASPQCKENMLSNTYTSYRLHSLRYICIFLIAFFELTAPIPLSAAPDAGKVSLAIYPFNDVGQNSFDMNIPAVLRAGFSGYGFIEIVPVEVIREKLYEIEPLLMWTEKEDSVKRGGILWKIEPRVVEKINETVSAQFSLYGDLTGFGDTWRVDAFVIKEGEPAPGRSFRLTGMKEEELPVRLTEMSKGIADWLRRENVLNEAEEDIRQYMGGMYSYAGVTGKLKTYIVSAPASIPLRALLLDLYLQDKDRHQEDIINDGLKIIELLGQGGDEDVRYLLSLTLDPFDAVAAAYEKKGEWEGAIAVRNKALRVFPYNSEAHKEGIGRSYYYIAKSFEEKGLREKAMESYKTAVFYLGPSSGYFKESMDGIERLKGKGSYSE